MTESETTPSRGVFLLPNLLTTGALFAGFYSVVAGINGDYVPAAIAIIIAAMLDGVDGRVARLTNTQSEFGTQYDSLSDLISFGLAPALLAYNWSLSSLGGLSPALGKIGWLAAFVYVACAALRLARFNTQAQTADKAFFQGLASPAAAGMLAVTVWFCVDQGLSGKTTMRWLVLMEVVILGLLMFSNFRYYSFKAWPKGDRVPVAWIFLLVMIFVLLALDPPSVLLAVGTLYITSGIVMTVLGKRRHRERRLRHQAKPGDADSGSEQDDSGLDGLD